MRGSFEKREEQYVGDYKLLHTIGEGHSGKVRLALHTITDETVAVKIVNKTKLDPAWIHKLIREVHIMKLLDHPNIIRLYEVIDTEATLYVFMEYAQGGELFDFIIDHNDRLPESTSRKIFRQMLSAVDYCHANFVVHRDLKAENVLLDKDLNVKIADFGFSNYFSPGSALETFCGSPDYCAPELFLRHSYEGPEVDVWAMGVILYIMVTSSMPFKDSLAVCECHYSIPPYVSPECFRLLKHMLNPDRAIRVTTPEIMGFAWVTGPATQKMQPCKRLEMAKPYLKTRSPKGKRTMGENEKRMNKSSKEVIDPEVEELMKVIGYTDEDIQTALEGHSYTTITATYRLFKDRKAKTPEKHVYELQAMRARQAATKAAIATALATTPSSSPSSSPSKDRMLARQLHRQSIFTFFGGNGDKEKDNNVTEHVPTGPSPTSTSPTSSPSTCRHKGHTQSPLSLSLEEGANESFTVSSPATVLFPRKGSRNRAGIDQVPPAFTCSSPRSGRKSSTPSSPCPNSPSKRPYKGPNFNIVGSNGEALSKEDISNARRSPASIAQRRHVSVSGAIGSICTKIRFISLGKSSLSDSADTALKLNQQTPNQQTPMKGSAEDDAGRQFSFTPNNDHKDQRVSSTPFDLSFTGSPPSDGF